VDFFEKLKSVQLAELLRKVRKVSVPKGKTVIREGDHGDTFFMIYSGKVSVWHVKNLFNRSILLTGEKFGLVVDKKKKQYDGSILLAVLKEGDFFGEMALVTNNRRTATVIAEEDCEFFVLNRDEFKKTLMDNPKISTVIERAFVNRMVKSIKEIGRRE